MSEDWLDATLKGAFNAGMYAAASRLCNGEEPSAEQVRRLQGSGADVFVYEYLLRVSPLRVSVQRLRQGWLEALESTQKRISAVLRRRLRTGIGNLVRICHLRFPEGMTVLVFAACSVESDAFESSRGLFCNQDCKKGCPLAPYTGELVSLYKCDGEPRNAWQCQPKAWSGTGHVLDAFPVHLAMKCARKKVRGRYPWSVREGVRDPASWGLAAMANSSLGEGAANAIMQQIPITIDSDGIICGGAWLEAKRDISDGEEIIWDYPYA